MTSTPAPGRALVVGSTGIIGQALSAQLVAGGWETFGLSRSGRAIDGTTAVAADLASPDALAAALDGVDPQLVAITAWTRQETEEQNIAVNGAAVRHVLAALAPSRSVRHVALMTGLKHYLGPFEAYGTGDMPDTPFREESPRLEYPNFYYAQEDELFEAARRDGFTWSVHRSHTVFGFATGNAMNMVLTLAAYATLCRELGLTFTFPGSQVQWDGVTDVTDADLLAEQIIWAGTHGAGQDQAFNIANGDVFRWRTLWPLIADHFGVPWEGFADRPRPLDDALPAEVADTWRRIAEEHDLVEPDLGRIASWWHTDADLGREMEALTDMNKSRTAGFTSSRDSRRSFFHHVDRYREARIIP